MTECMLGRPDHGRTVEVRAGARLVVELPETPSTGYAWEWETATSAIVLPEDDAVEPPSAQQPGAEGMRRFRLRAALPGLAPLRAVLRRPWEPREAAIESWEVQVRVLPAR